MREIITPLVRHSLTPLLVVVQVVIATAIACNALFLLQQRLTPLLASDGVGHPGRLIVVSRIALHGPPPSAARLQAIVEELHTVPDVASVSTAMTLPMIGDAPVDSLESLGTKVKTSAVQYVGDHLIDTLDVQLTTGRNFTPEENAASLSLANRGGLAGPTIITQALARKLFPDENPLGKQIMDGDPPYTGILTVVGVVNRLIGNDLGGGTQLDLGYTMLVPGLMSGWPSPVFGVRVAHGADIGTVRNAVAAKLDQLLGADLTPGIKPRSELYETLRHEALAPARAVAWLLACVMLIVLITTFAGIKGLASYWVQSRTHALGIRRALGARRRDILSYLQFENLLLVGLGGVIGIGAAFVVNLWLMRHYELSRLPWVYLPIGALAMLILGQLGVLGPAIRASRVPPSVAIRAG